jgi:ketosteroid isomerase-like protein
MSCHYGITRIIYELYSAYAEGRFEYLLAEAVDEDIKFFSSAPQPFFPHYGKGQGKPALLAAWRASRVEYEFLSYLPVLIVADGVDSAAIVVQMSVRRVSTGRVMSLMVADFLRFRDNRVVEFRQFMDTLDATEQWLGREIDVSKL